MIILLESIYSLNSCQGRAAFLLCSDLPCTKLHFGQIVSIDNLITLLLFCRIISDQNVYSIPKGLMGTIYKMYISDCKSESKEA